MTVEYALISRGRFPATATDLVTFRQRPHPDYPDLPCASCIVSRADVASVRSTGKRQVPTRDEHGERLSDIHDRQRTKAKADAFAARHGWPFTICIENIDAYEELPAVSPACLPPV